MRSARGLALLCGFLKNDEWVLTLSWGSKRIDTKVSILLGLQFPLFLSLAKIGERRPLRKWGTAVGLLLRSFREISAVHRQRTATHVVYSTQVLDVISRLTSCAALLSPRGPSLALRAIHLVPRLRR